MRTHGTTQCRPAEAFRASAQGRLLPAPAAPYDTPKYAIGSSTRGGTGVSTMSVSRVVVSPTASKRWTCRQGNGSDTSRRRKGAAGRGRRGPPPNEDPPEAGPQPGRPSSCWPLLPRGGLPGGISRRMAPGRSCHIKAQCRGTRPYVGSDLARSGRAGALDEPSEGSSRRRFAPGSGPLQEYGGELMRL